MSVVKFNVLTVPEGAGATLEERFAKRAGRVEDQPGFEEFQLLRPVEGNDKYLVYTRWRSEEDFQNWVKSRDFSQGHSQTSDDEASKRPAPAATDSEIWGYEVVQRVEGEK
ncbi:MAG TPA: antibiotic biosynthesis monooxygenase [Candidatus Nocardiopsis merdipullorum]|nr:antibiotic biosynthesis monooxygenase [Candidatus Nocardiopsis merdipullorum]